MSALVIPFPRQAPMRALCAGGQALAPFTAAWCARHLPLIDAAVDLLSADDVEFARRYRLMRDEDGRAMVDELAGQLQRLGAHIADVADALGLTAERLRGEMSARA